MKKQKNKSKKAKQIEWKTILISALMDLGVGIILLILNLIFK